MRFEKSFGHGMEPKIFWPASGGEGRLPGNFQNGLDPYG
jgi:hypothetical protein